MTISLAVSINLVSLTVRGDGVTIGPVPLIFLESP